MLKRILDCNSSLTGYHEPVIHNIRRNLTSKRSHNMIINYKPDFVCHATCSRLAAYNDGGLLFDRKLVRSPRNSHTYVRTYCEQLVTSQPSITIRKRGKCHTENVIIVDKTKRKLCHEMIFVSRFIVKVN